MTIQELTAADFKPFGRILSGDGEFPAVAQSNEFEWHDTASGIAMDGSCCTGMLCCRSRPRVVSKMERHLRTSEVLFPLRGDSVLVVAAAGDTLGTTSGLRAFRLPVGKAVVMNVGTWHWIPFPLAEADSHILVLFRDGTGADDLDFKQLPESVRV